MKIVKLYPGSFGANCWLLLSHDGHTAVVDPSPNADTILDAVKKENAILTDIFLTHGHFDHILSLDTLREKTGVKAWIHADDFELPSDPVKNAFETFFHQKRSWNSPDKTFSDGDILKIGDESVTVLHTAGHTAGSVCFLCNDGHDILTGDTLFENSYGRCDLYGGDIAKMQTSLARLSQEKLSAVIHAGHGNETTLEFALESIGMI